MQKAVWLVCLRFGLPKDMRLFICKRATRIARRLQLEIEIEIFLYPLHKFSRRFPCCDLIEVLVEKCHSHTIGELRVVFTLRDYRYRYPRWKWIK
jgi:hypothetical protein